jgi:selenium metabolism protein YedF
MIDVMGKPCHIPVMEAKKALAEHGIDSVLLKVDNIVSVQNLEKMANGYGCDFSYSGETGNSFEVTINKGGKEISAFITEKSNHQTAHNNKSETDDNSKSEIVHNGRLERGNRDTSANGTAVVISRDTMGEGAEELGKILIKGFIYSLTELPKPPDFVIFLNSGAYLTSQGSNTIDDLKKLEEKGTEVLTCGTCANYYGLHDKLAVGAITDMYGITEKMAYACNTINI